MTQRQGPVRIWQEGAHVRREVLDGGVDKAADLLTQDELEHAQHLHERSGSRTLQMH